MTQKCMILDVENSINRFLQDSYEKNVIKLRDFQIHEYYKKITG